MSQPSPALPPDSSTGITFESIIHVVRARYVDAHRVWLRFEDGLEGEIDLGGELDGENFEPLHDLLAKERRSGAA